eukprot:9585073-Alexandrium_andersonii.AAC.1
MDGWGPLELGSIPMEASSVLARMLMAIEGGCRWPQDLTHASCAYMAKAPTFSPIPTEYRGISVLSIIYRTWAKLRLFQMRSWQQQWKHEALHAGVPGLGFTRCVGLLRGQK